MIDFRAQLPPVRDQGPRGTCVAFAVTAAHEIRRAQGERLSDGFLYWGCKQGDGTGGGSGTTLPAAASALAQYGQSVEALWPYEPGWDDNVPVRTPSAAAIADGASRLCTGLRRLPATVDQITAALAGGRVVVLVTWVFENWRRADRGVIALPETRDRRLGLHAVLTAGYRTGPGPTSIVIRNSWGRDWGDDGYGYLSGGYVDMHAVSAWVLD